MKFFPKNMSRQFISARFLCFSSVLLGVYLYSIPFLYNSCSYSPMRFPHRSQHVSIPSVPPLLISGPRLPIVKIYMYDAPEKFTYGVIEAYLKSRSINDSALRYPGHQHSAEWWLFYDLLKRQSERSSLISLRVDHPEDADVFFAPFFSSLSLLVNPPGSNFSIQRSNYSDEAMQREYVEWLEAQPTWRRNAGRDHVIICQDPNALHLVMSRIKNSILLLSDFGRLEPNQGSWWKDVILPYSHRVASYVRENTTLERNTLLFFMGNRYRKEGGKIRDELFNVLQHEEGVVLKHGLQSREGRRWAAEGMRTSKFCLHPAGDTPSACRLFDAIVSLCVPVVVSDNIELPFEDELDYTKFALFVPSNKAVERDYLITLLREFNNSRLHQYQQELRKVRKFFEYGEPDGAVEQIWRVIQTKIPQVKTMINRDRRTLEKHV